MKYYIDQNYCANCIGCGTTCPTGAVVFNGVAKEIDQGKCIDCGRCLSYCNIGAIKTFEDEKRSAAIVKHNGYLEMDAALVVIGAGGGGMVASARAAYLGVKNIVVLEKMYRYGGSAWFAHNLRAFNSKFQQSKGIKDPTKDIIRDMQRQTNWELDPELVRDTIRESGAFFDWVCEIGDHVENRFELDEYPFEAPGGPLIPHYIEDQKTQDSMGIFMMSLMKKVCDEHGVQILTKHPVVDWEVQDGKITAVIAESEEGKVRVSCKACILSPGSWINNEEIVKKYVPLYARAQKPRSNHRLWANTGDGIALAEKAGAYVDYSSFLIRYLTTFPFTPTTIGMQVTADARAICVNLDGKRWIDEVNATDPHGAGLRNAQQPEGVSFAVFDDALLTKIGEEMKAPPPPDRSPAMGPLTPRPADWDIHDEFQEAFNEPIVTCFKADTIEELAEQMGVPTDALVETVDRFNRDCDNGSDELYFKPDELLFPIRKAPFYAVKTGLGTDGAFGGVLVNKNIQAYDKNMKPMDGLYVCGDFSSGRFRNVNGVKVQIINDFTWATTSGWIAANHVAKWLAK